jgi:hypothetical protein
MTFFVSSLMAMSAGVLPKASSSVLEAPFLINSWQILLQPAEEASCSGTVFESPPGTFGLAPIKKGTVIFHINTRDK